MQHEYRYCTDKRLFSKQERESLRPKEIVAAARKRFRGELHDEIFGCCVLLQIAIERVRADNGENALRLGNIAGFQARGCFNGCWIDAGEGRGIAEDQYFAIFMHETEGIVHVQQER